jgi:hypothetical protein
MIRRMLLAISFVAALGVAEFAVTDTADAHGYRRGGHGYHGAYYGGGWGYGGGYGHYPHVYRASYYPSIYYGEPIYYGRSYYGGGHHCHRPGGSYISIGF